jgi:hypothetical protein
MALKITPPPNFKFKSFFEKKNIPFLIPTFVPLLHEVEYDEQGEFCFAIAHRPKNPKCC